jgi:hypothetical protein
MVMSSSSSRRGRRGRSLSSTDYYMSAAAALAAAAAEQQQRPAGVEFAVLGDNGAGTIRCSDVGPSTSMLLLKCSAGSSYTPTASFSKAVVAAAAAALNTHDAAAAAASRIVCSLRQWPGAGDVVLGCCMGREEPW